MKRKNYIELFCLNQINIKLFGFFWVLIAIVFYSCSSEDESVNQSGMTKAKIKSEKIQTIGEVLTGLPVSEQENLNSYSEQIFVHLQSLEIALNRNSSLDFNPQAMQALNAAKNENDLKIVFEMAGIANSQEVINILKDNVKIQQEFISQNPIFYSLSVEEQVGLLNSGIALAKIGYHSQIPNLFDGLVGNNNCAGDFNRAIGRCNGDFGTCAVFAVAGAYAGLAPGLLAAAYCMVTKLTCDKRAKEDYKICTIEQVYPGGPTPPTGVVTLHCDKFADTCWTTDSNGKYIETLK